MAKASIHLSAFVGKLLEEQDGDVLREGIRVLAQALMETEVAGLISAERHERWAERSGYGMAIACGPGIRAWAPSKLAIPKGGPGPTFPPCSSRAGARSMPCWR